VSAPTWSGDTRDTAGRCNRGMPNAPRPLPPRSAHAHAHADATPDGGLALDLATMAARGFDRRRLLGWVGAAALAGCGGGGDDAGATTAAAASGTGTSVASCSVVPSETEGPYPGDGSNSVSGGIVNVLALSGVVRSDIRPSFAGATGTAEGVPLTLDLRLVDTNASCADLSGWAIYLWHCDREGRYSLYSAGVANQNHLRGVQPTSAGGVATFTTVFPGCYAGRMPHLHVEVFRSTNSATAFTNKLRTTQIALPTDVCQAVYGTASGYAASLSNLARMSFATDGIFSDGYATQLATVTGSVAGGYAASLVLGVPG
jgi:protocatechuate 3,4-dioxygenase beta subunit